VEEGCAAHDANYRRVAHDLQVEEFCGQYRRADGQSNMRLFSQDDADSHSSTRTVLQRWFPWGQLTHCPIVSSNGRPPVVGQTQTSDVVLLLAAATQGSVAVYSNGQHGGQPNTDRFYGDAAGNCPRLTSWTAAAVRQVLAQLQGSQLADMCAFQVEHTPAGRLPTFGSGPLCLPVCIQTFMHFYQTGARTVLLGWMKGWDEVVPRLHDSGFEVRTLWVRMDISTLQVAMVRKNGNQWCAIYRLAHPVLMRNPPVADMWAAAITLEAALRGTTLSSTPLEISHLILNGAPPTGGRMYNPPRSGT
jgi:hypothetical protein